ncbi:protein unzipped [Microplitis mediator]|uniref:protein unzipped n=1 Tax=Microplitis mediator TaxID=375433 RepID=UPI0025554305|nr:protein unzipped [Microplitis mediator]
MPSTCNRSVVLLLMLSVVTFSNGDNSVHIYSKLQQYVTSSTLNWLPVNHYDPSKEIVIGGFQRVPNVETNGQDSMTKERALYVCRVYHGGIWVAGSQIEGQNRCTVTSLGNFYSYERYELLENVENSARLSWLPWDKFRKIPAGAVAADTMFVARHPVSAGDEEDDGKNDGVSPSYTHYIGTLDPKDKLGTITYVKANGETGSKSEGEVLVETEPLYYDLRSVKLSHRRKRVIKNEPMILGEATITNSRDEPAKLAEAFGYSYKYFSYWGQGHAMIKALNTSVTLVNGTKLMNVAWGMEDKYNRTDIFTVEIYLEPGTAVNVTLKANYMDMEVPYTGELISHYEDGQQRSRDISGMRREETMRDITPEFSPIYFISNFSIVPTTLAPPTTRTTTGTTTSLKSSTFTSSSTGYSKSGAMSDETTPDMSIKEDEDDENLIIPPRKSDPGMQNDDGGPLSLKNKEPVAVTGFSNVLKSSITLLLTSMFVSLYRIT